MVPTSLHSVSIEHGPIAQVPAPGGGVGTDAASAAEPASLASEPDAALPLLLDADGAAVGYVGTVPLRPVDAAPLLLLDADGAAVGYVGTVPLRPVDAAPLLLLDADGAAVGYVGTVPLRPVDAAPLLLLDVDGAAVGYVGARVAGGVHCIGGYVGTVPLRSFGDVAGEYVGGARVDNHVRAVGVAQRIGPLSIGCGCGVAGTGVSVPLRPVDATPPLLDVDGAAVGYVGARVAGGVHCIGGYVGTVPLRSFGDVAGEYVGGARVDNHVRAVGVAQRIGPLSIGCGCGVAGTGVSVPLRPVDATPPLLDVDGAAVGYVGARVAGGVHCIGGYVGTVPLRSFGDVAGEYVGGARVDNHVRAVGVAQRIGPLSIGCGCGVAGTGVSVPLRPVDATPPLLDVDGAAVGYVGARVAGGVHCIGGYVGTVPLRSFGDVAGEYVGGARVDNHVRAVGVAQRIGPLSIGCGCGVAGTGVSVPLRPVDATPPLLDADGAAVGYVGARVAGGVHCIGGYVGTVPLRSFGDVAGEYVGGARVDNHVRAVGVAQRIGPLSGCAA